MTLGFRRLERRDLPLLSHWLGSPHVATWWRDDCDPASVEAAYAPRLDGRDPTEVFVVEADGEPIGVIQRYRIADYPEWERSVAAGGAPGPAAGLDYFIGDETLTGRGLGGRIIAGFAEDTWRRYPDVAAIVVAVQQANRRSWRALEKAGFEPHWAGTLDSDDPSDEGPVFMYVRHRPPDDAVQPA